MPLQYKIGDLLESDCNIIAHQCNCYCIMGGGIARQIRLKYPEAYQADLETIRGDRSKLGTFSMGHNGTRIIYNLYGQYGYGSGLQTDYRALEMALRAMRKDIWINYVNIWPEVGVPFGMGCGLAGGDWPTVEDIINNIFVDETIYAYKLG